jgi:hypothetical protein
MYMSLTLSEADLTAAITDWLDQRGFFTKQVSFHVTEGDRPGDSCGAE